MQNKVSLGWQRWPCRWQFDGDILCKRFKSLAHTAVVWFLSWLSLRCRSAWQVAPPSECCWSGADDGIVAILATSDSRNRLGWPVGSTSSMGFAIRELSVVTMFLKYTVVELEAYRTDGQTDVRRIAIASTVGVGGGLKSFCELSRLSALPFSWIERNHSVAKSAFTRSFRSQRCFRSTGCSVRKSIADCIEGG